MDGWRGKGGSGRIEGGREVGGEGRWEGDRGWERGK